MEDEIFKQSSQNAPKSQSRTPPMCLCLTTESGPTPGAFTKNWGGGALLGEFTTRSFGECPSEENESHLLQILEVSAPQKYRLSAKACQGILRRAEKRGKELPKLLEVALLIQSKETL